MPNYRQYSERLSSALDLATGPVAVIFTARPLEGHAAPSQPVAAGCMFWELGASEALATSASDHANCSIGVYTHKLAGAPQSQASELETTLAAMRGLEYLKPGEVETIPVMPRESQLVCYTPLSQCQESPALVLLFANARQGLIITEAIARVDGANPLSLGRPACALIPQVLNNGQSAASLGCCGARAYLKGFDDSVTLWALNGEQLPAYAEAIDTLAEANKTLTHFHQLRGEMIAAGGSPTVQQSLERLN